MVAQCGDEMTGVCSKCGADGKVMWKDALKAFLCVPCFKEAK